MLIRVLKTVVPIRALKTVVPMPTLVRVRNTIFYGLLDLKDALLGVTTSSLPALVFHRGS